MAALRAALMCLLLAGCVTPPELRVVQTPKAPVIVAPARPDIPDGTSPSEVVRKVRGYIEELEHRLQEAIAALSVYQ